MSTIDLDKHGSWTLDTRPDFEGEIELVYADGYESGGSVYLSTSTMMTLWSMFDSITSRCLCSYIAERAICDEYEKYTLTEPHPECPFHGEKK